MWAVVEIKVAMDLAPSITTDWDFEWGATMKIQGMQGARACDKWDSPQYIVGQEDQLCRDRWP
jgi:hypothetical protein